MADQTTTAPAAPVADSQKPVPTAAQMKARAEKAAADLAALPHRRSIHQKGPLYLERQASKLKLRKQRPGAGNRR